jgi:hypothetical protein
MVNYLYDPERLEGRGHVLDVPVRYRSATLTVGVEAEL